MDKYIFCLIISVFIVASDYPLQLEAYRVVVSNNVSHILTFQRENITLECKSESDSPLAYCRLAHEYSTRHVIAASKLKGGICRYNMVASRATAGLWQCFLGRKGSGPEEETTMMVRIVGEVAAVERDIISVYGDSVTLHCVTRTYKPLRYCRFEPPTGTPFSVHPDDVPEKYLLDRYYYPKNKTYENGDCTVTIRKLQHEDTGTWTCGIGLLDGQEFKDLIKVEVKGLHTRINKSLLVLVLASIGAVLTLTTCGLIAWIRQATIIGEPPVNEEANVIALQRAQTPEAGPSNISPSVEESPLRSLTSRV